MSMQTNCNTPREIQGWQVYTQPLTGQETLGQFLLKEPKPNAR